MWRKVCREALTRFDRKSQMKKNRRIGLFEESLKKIIRSKRGCWRGGRGDGEGNESRFIGSLVKENEALGW